MSGLNSFFVRKAAVYHTPRYKKKAVQGKCGCEMFDLLYFSRGDALFSLNWFLVTFV